MADAKITIEVRDVLERSKIEMNAVHLPADLPRPLYEAVNKVLVNAGGKWNRTARAHIFSSDPRPKLGLALKTGVALDDKKLRQAFNTPEEVARRVMLWAGIQPGHRVLEPSAGLGMLALYARDEGGVVDCVEVDRESYEALTRLKGLGHLKHADFLELMPHILYDRIVMNPPFAKGQDIKHVAHALKFLAAGGRLVAIMMPNIEESRRKEWHAVCRDRSVKYVPVEAGAFKQSGTKTATTIVIIE